MDGVGTALDSSLPVLWHKYFHNQPMHTLQGAVSADVGVQMLCLG